jgi:hypothetical protein
MLGGRNDPSSSKQRFVRNVKELGFTQHGIIFILIGHLKNALQLGVTL